LQGELCVIGKKFNGTFLMKTKGGKIYSLENKGAAEFDGYLAVPNMLANGNWLQRLVYSGVIIGLTFVGYDASPAEWKPT
jgi:hypothetical protein